MPGMMSISVLKLGLKSGIMVLLLALTACAQQALNKGLPSWLSNPGNGVVASCGFHIGGHYQQQECAIQRGRERLAARQGVAITSISVIKERVVDGQETVLMNKETTANVATKQVKARVKASYYDVQRDEYYVWVVPN